MKRTIAATLMTLFAAPGCGSPPPVKTLRVSNPAYTVDELFTDPNGCTVYRFYDQGGYHYYTAGERAGQMIRPKPETEQ